jgi:hypothetical protein
LPFLGCLVAAYYRWSVGLFAQRRDGATMSGPDEMSGFRFRRSYFPMPMIERHTSG